MDTGADFEDFLSEDQNFNPIPGTSALKIEGDITF
jgi:hypothetical protein